jgi:polysaccharide export outer membrane protein
MAEFRQKMIMRARSLLSRLSVVGAMSLTMAACAHDPVEFIAAGSPEPVVPVMQAAYDAGPADLNGPYILDTGDKLRVFVYGQPNLSRAYTVDQDGRIAVPLIGDVEARGRTTNDLEHAIRSRLGAEFVRDPQVTVDVLQNRPFFILGEVKAAGQYPFVSGMTVETAIAIAGGYSDRASERQFRVTRRKNGYVEQFEAPSEYPIQPGDTVYVYERFF